jgi:hypothetical protein
MVPRRREGLIERLLKGAAGLQSNRFPVGKLRLPKSTPAGDGQNNQRRNGQSSLLKKGSDPVVNA